MAELFISYSRHDAAFVRRLCEALTARQREAWVDWQDIPPTAAWRSEIANAIDAASAVVFVISEQSAASAECRRELEHAAAQGKRLVPVVLRPPTGVEMLPCIAELNWLFLREEELSEGVERLLAAVDTDLAWSRAHARLLQQAQDWQAAERDTAKLLRGRDLAEAERWLAEDRPDPKPVAVQRTFVSASRAAAKRKRQRLLISLASVATLALALVLWAVFERGVADQRERQALSRRLTQQADTLRAGRPDQSTLAVQLAVEAVRRDPSFEAVQALTAGLALLPRQQWQDALPSTSGVGLAFTPDGQRLVNADAVWDVADGKRQLEFRHEGRSTLFALSHDGRWMLRTGGNRPLSLFDRDSGAPIALQAPERAAPIEMAVFSANSRLVAAADRLAHVHLWRVADGRLLFSRPPEEPQLSGPVAALAFAPDGSWLAVARRQRVRRLAVADGQALEPPLPVQGGSTIGLAVAPDGRIATLSRSGEVLLHAADGSSTALPPLPPSSQRGATTLQFGAGGRLLGAAGAEGVQIWDLESKAVRLSLPTGPLLAFSVDGRRVALGGKDSSVRLFDLADFNELLRTAHPAPVDALALSPDGRWLGTACADGQLRLWSTERAYPAITLKGDQGRMIQGRLLATTDDGGAELAGISDASPIDLSGRDVHVSADGSLLVLAQQDTLRAYALPAGALVSSLAHEPPIDWPAVEAATRERHLADLRVHGFKLDQLRQRGSAQVAALGPDGRRLLSTRVDELARLWDTRSSRVIVSIPYIETLQAAFSADGRFLLTTSDRDLQLLDAERGTLRWRWTAPALIEQAVLGSGGELVALRAGQGAMLWRAGAASPSASVAEASALWPAPDDRSVVVVAPGQAQIWSLAGDVAPVVLRCDCRIETVAFSGDGRWVALAAEDGSLHLHPTAPDAAADRWIEIAAGDGVSMLALNSNGSAIAATGSTVLRAETEANAGQPLPTGVQEPWLRLWRLPGGEELVLEAERAEAGTLLFSPEGGYLAAGSLVWELERGQRVARVAGEITGFAADPPRLLTRGDGIVRAWPWRTEDLLALACRQLRGGLPREAWERYVGKEVTYVDGCATGTR